MSNPFRVGDGGARLPRALPWAVGSHPVGVSEFEQDFGSKDRSSQVVLPRSGLEGLATLAFRDFDKGRITRSGTSSQR